MTESWKQCNDTLTSEMMAMEEFDSKNMKHVEKRCHVIKMFAGCLLNNSVFPADQDFPFEEQKRIQVRTIPGNMLQDPRLGYSF